MIAEAELKDDEFKSSLDSIKAWLSSRPIRDTFETVTISAPDGLRAIGFADLTLEKFGPHHMEEIVYCHEQSNDKPKNWTELSHLITWSDEFSKVLKNNRASLATLELVRGLNDYPISLAYHRVDEAIAVVNSAINFDLGLDIRHPDTRAQTYAINDIPVDDLSTLHNVTRQIFASLYSKCVVRLIVDHTGRSSQFYAAALAAYLVDLMHQSGATNDEVICVAFDRRESMGNERFLRSITPIRISKLSTMALVFKSTDTFAAAQGIIESYYREQYPNLIIMVEESAYERFVQDWQRYYSHAVHIGLRLDKRTTVVEELNSRVKIDLDAIDIKAAHKMGGNAINVLRFRTVPELLSMLVTNLRKIPFMSIWNEDVLLSREFCLRLNLCNEFWLNHVPKSLAGYQFSEDVMNNYAEAVANDMTHLYNTIYSQHVDDAEQLRRTHATFMKKEARLRNNLIIQAHALMVTKSKSLKNGCTVSESISKLKRFKEAYSHRMFDIDSGNSRVETITKPVGLALLYVREEGSIKSKAVLVELIFKNLLLGNAVLLVCPPNTLGFRFKIENDHIIPFKMVHENVLDLSKLSLDSSFDAQNTSMCKKQCPKNTYAIEILPEMNSESCEAITVALGTRQKSILYSNIEQADYWLDK